MLKDAYVVAGTGPSGAEYWTLVRSSEAAGPTQSAAKSDGRFVGQLFDPVRGDIHSIRDIMLPFRSIRFVCNHLNVPTSPPLHFFFF
jgi:hypothetical protein